MVPMAMRLHLPFSLLCLLHRYSIQFFLLGFPQQFNLQLFPLYFLQSVRLKSFPLFFPLIIQVFPKLEAQQFLLSRENLPYHLCLSSS